MDLVFVFWWRHYTCHSRKQKIQQQDDWTWTSTQGNKHRIDFLGIAEAVQPHVHSCAPTNAMMFGSGHFQDHRAVVLAFPTVEMTGPQVARQYRTAICDRQLLLQESVQCSLQQWWQATPCLPQGLTPNQSDALLAKWMRCGLSSVAPQPRKSRSNHGWIALRSIKCSANPLGDGSGLHCNKRSCASRKSSGFLSCKWVLLRSMLRRLTTLC